MMQVKVAIWVGFCGLFGLVGSAFAQDAVSAKAFLNQIYQPYQHGEDSDPLGHGAERIFADELLALIREDQRLADGEVGLIDADPLCQCQDIDRLTKLELKVSQVSKTAARAKVSFSHFGETVGLTYQLVWGAQGWRVSDIIDSDQQSLKSNLIQGLEDLRNAD